MYDLASTSSISVRLAHLLLRQRYHLLPPLALVADGKKKPGSTLVGLREPVKPAPCAPCYLPLPVSSVCLGYLDWIVGASMVSMLPLLCSPWLHHAFFCILLGLPDDLGVSPAMLSTSTSFAFSSIRLETTLSLVQLMYSRRWDKLVLRSYAGSVETLRDLTKLDRDRLGFGLCFVFQSCLVRS